MEKSLKIFCVILSSLFESRKHFPHHILGIFYHIKTLYKRKKKYQIFSNIYSPEALPVNLYSVSLFKSMQPAVLAFLPFRLIDHPKQRIF